MGDVKFSDLSHLPFYVLSSGGLYVHDPGTKGSILLRPGLFDVSEEVDRVQEKS